MSIRSKMLAAIVVTFALLFLALYLGARTVVLASFEELERVSAVRNVERIQVILADNISAMVGTNRDWAHWDDTYYYALGENEAYIEENISVDTVANIGMNMMLFYDVNQDLLYAEVVDLDSYENIPFPDGLSEFFTGEESLLNHNDIDSQFAGFVRTGDHLIMLTSVPILQNGREGEIAGSLVMGRFLDAPQVEVLAESLQFNMILIPYSNELATQSEGLAALSADTPVTTEVRDADTIVGYGLLYNIYGDPVAAIQIDIAREIYSQGLQTVQLLATVLLITGFVMVIATAVVLEFTVIRRITLLSNEVDEIKKSGFDGRHVTVSSSDEVSNLSANINGMLDSLESNRKQLAEQNDALKIAYEQSEEATRLKSEFLSTMSHELRTPLNAIVGYSGIMLEGIGGEIDDDARSMIANVNDSSEHLLQLINDILDISKIEAGRFELVPDNFAVRPMLDSLKTQMAILPEQKQIGFTVKVDEDVPMLLVGDKERISQIIINLLSNAFKFTEKGGVYLNTHWQDEKLVMKVRDTGIGIPPHALQYIFDEFRQVDGGTSRTYQGTGLGLSIVKKLGELMGGSVTVESTVGEGTTFTVTLPLKRTIQTTQAEESV